MSYQEAFDRKFTLLHSFSSELSFEIPGIFIYFFDFFPDLLYVKYPVNLQIPSKKNEALFCNNYAAISQKKGFFKNKFLRNSIVIKMVKFFVEKKVQKKGLQFWLLKILMHDTLKCILNSVSIKAVSYWA